MTEGIIQKTFRKYITKKSEKNDGMFHWTQVLDIEKLIIAEIRYKFTFEHHIQLEHWLIGDNEE